MRPSPILSGRKDILYGNVSIRAEGSAQVSAWNLTGGTGGGSFAPASHGAADAPGSHGAERDALSVSEAAELASGALRGVPKITVLGEVSGFRGPNARSGHCYFQIKD